MAVRDILSALGRRWYVVALALLGAMALTLLFIRDGGSYSTRTVVTFTLPARTTILPDSGTNDSSVIAFAGAVATEINGGRPVPNYSSSDAPFYGAGIREGVVVGLRNAGNQWVTSFPSATIEIQIVGRTREWVETTQASLLSKILAVTEAQQVNLVTSPEDRISAAVEPLSMKIDAVSASRTAQLLAVVAMALAAGIIGTWGALMIDRMVARRRSDGPVDVRRSHVRTLESRIT